ncbi:helix-turn-helix domain-containing protein [Roseateles cellulosilyticus]|uniref:Helix-turn-helix domain-containing protein n=1 Tax=Pelomonas cellulosilytica TaxID=2906762 RepID=A0ABS8XUG8_9BURK|nr:helix-turn-helix domain-containing protein [Pelomonas sp. P8]MCE4552900.1 helix-turn-helix domain-containing protein [Pelomonas sp. P8]
MAERDEIKSLKKALRAITFMNQHGDVTATQVAQGIGVPRATSYRLLQTLASAGYVDKLPNSDIYRLTSLVRHLAAGFRDEELLIEIARPLLAEAQRELGWAIALSTPRDTEMVVRLNTDHDSPLALIRYGVGASLPILLSTCGYCYLAHCQPAERESIVNTTLERDELRRAVHFDRPQIQQLIDDARLNGYCHLEFDHYREGNLGVPLLLAGRPVGGIVMRYIKSTLRNKDKLREVYAPRLQKLARDIAERHPAQAAAAPGQFGV